MQIWRSLLMNFPKMILDEMLLALFSVVKELDAIEEPGVDLVDLIEKTKKLHQESEIFL